MSYAHLSTALAEEDDLEHIAADGEFVKPRYEERHVQHKWFKSSRSLHTAISFAAGTVMLLFGYEQGQW